MTRSSAKNQPTNLKPSATPVTKATPVNQQGRSWSIRRASRSIRREMQIDDRLVPLEPGMAVTAEIKTGSRHIIEYLLSPLLRHKQMALRER